MSSNKELKILYKKANKNTHINASMKKTTISDTRPRQK